MSLINEALKRTRDAAYQPVHTPPSSVTGEAFRERAKPGGSKQTVLIVVLIAVLAIAGVILLGSRIATGIQGVKNGFGSSGNSAAAEAKQPVVVPSPTPMAPHALHQPSAAAPNADPKTSEDQIVAKVMEKIKAEQPSAPTMPQLVLQGITYAADNRDAMINGVTVHEGEDIEGARVLTIDDRKVTLTFNGHEIILRLP
jgi:hypothetical protein